MEQDENSVFSLLLSDGEGSVSKTWKFQVFSNRSLVAKRKRSLLKFENTFLSERNELIIKDRDEISFGTMTSFCNTLLFPRANQFDSPYLNRVDCCTHFDLQYQPQPNNSNRPLFQAIENKRRFSI